MSKIRTFPENPRMSSQQRAKLDRKRQEQKPEADITLLIVGEPDDLPIDKVAALLDSLGMTQRGEAHRDWHVQSTRAVPGLLFGRRETFYHTHTSIRVTFPPRDEPYTAADFRVLLRKLSRMGLGGRLEIGWRGPSFGFSPAKARIARAEVAA